MKIEFTATGSPEIVREDGWRYRLDGIGQIEFDHESLYAYGLEPARYFTTALEVTIYSLDDKTLDSIRVLRDEFSGYSIRLHHDY